MQAVLGNRRSAIKAVPIRTGLDAFQGLFNGQQFRGFMLVHGELQVSGGIDLAAVVMAVVKVIAGLFGTADAPTALLGDLRQQCRACLL